MTRYGEDVRATVAAQRPDLLPHVDDALPGARAAVLSRLLGALFREPVPGVGARDEHRGAVRIGLADGRRVEGPAAAARPFAAAPPGLEVCVVDPAGGVGTHRDPGDLLRALRLPGQCGRLTAEVDDSVTNLALARAAAAARSLTAAGSSTAARSATAAGSRPGVPVLRAASGDPDGAGRLEQLVTDGHPLHPCCRTRGGMDVGDVLAYAPEHRPVLRLRRYRVPADRWHGTGEPVLLVHPWQAEHVLGAYPWLVADGESGPVRPLMSLRTVAPLDGGDHVKTAVDVQMTSAVRAVSPAAVHNGPVLSALLGDLTADLPGLRVLPETVAGAVLVDGVPHRHLAHLIRQAPPVAPGATVVPLGALAAVHGGRPLLAEVVDGYGGDPYAWFTDLTGLLLPPLLTVLARGVALEAHGQNTLLVLRGGRPVTVLYRDLGGVRVHPARLRAAGVDPPALRGDLLTDDPAALRTKLSAAVFGTLIGEQVALLGRHHHAEADRLWAIAAATVRRAATGDAAALLTGGLPVKAMTAMRLADDPLDDVWAWLPNPMAAHA